MSNAFLAIAQTPAVKAAQEAQGSRSAYARLEHGPPGNDRIGPGEAAFVAARDSIYIATVSESGWPYMQHRGGPPGFVHVLDERTLAMPDFRGNRQYITLGNVAGDARAALFLIDYPARRRLKIFAWIEVRDLGEDDALRKRLATPGYNGVVERAFVVHVAAFDWNCPQHITPRFSQAEIADAVAPLREKVATLEAENAALRAAVATKRS